MYLFKTLYMRYILCMYTMCHRGQESALDLLEWSDTQLWVLRTRPGSSRKAIGTALSPLSSSWLCLLVPGFDLCFVSLISLSDGEIYPMAGASTFTFPASEGWGPESHTTSKLGRKKNSRRKAFDSGQRVFRDIHGQIDSSSRSQQLHPRRS